MVEEGYVVVRLFHLIDSGYMLDKCRNKVSGAIVITTEQAKELNEKLRKVNEEIKNARADFEKIRTPLQQEQELIFAEYKAVAKEVKD